MWQNILLKLQTTVLGGALIVSSAWVVSRILGLIRERLIASTFGSVGAVPIYTAFAIPDFIYGTLVLGSLLTAFIPVFLQYQKKDEGEAWRISRAILNIVIVVFLVTGLILFLAAGPIAQWLLIGKHSSDVVGTTAHLMRIMSLNMMLFAAGNVFAGVLQSRRHFFAVSMAPILNNLGLVVGIVLLSERWGTAGVAWGAVLGAILHVVIQGTAAWRIGWRFGQSAGWHHPGVKQIGRLLIPRTIGQSVTQIDQFVNIPIANRLGGGNLSIFHWANVIQDAPVGIIGVSMATVSFPIFVELLRDGKKEEFVKQFSSIVRQILFLIIPITVIFLQLRAQFVRVIIGAEPVSWPETIATAQTLGFFALSFFAQSLIPVLARSFYAMQDTKTPVRITTLAVGLDIVGSIILGFSMGVRGIALSFTISSILSAILLFVALHRRIGHLDEEKILQSVMRIIGVTILMALAVQGAKIFLVSFGLDLTRFVGVLAQAIGAGAVGGISYLIFAVLFRLEEASMVARIFHRLRRIVRNGTPVHPSP